MSQFSDLYGQEPASPEVVFGAIVDAVENRRPLSLVRAGDVVACLLLGRFGAIRPHVYRFLGLPNPPPKEAIAQLSRALATADILGPIVKWPVADLPKRFKRLLRHRSVKPAILTRSYINNALYTCGYLNELLKRYRVAFVGRSAAKASSRYASPHFRLDHWKELDSILADMLEREEEWDLALVGASVPGRILCSMLRDAGKVAIDIGHNLDALAYPEVWSSVRSPRGYFKNQYLVKKGLKPRSKRSGNTTVVQTSAFGGAAGWSFFKGC